VSGADPCHHAGWPTRSVRTVWAWCRSDASPILREDAGADVAPTVSVWCGVKWHTGPIGNLLCRQCSSMTTIGIRHWMGIPPRWCRDRPRSSVFVVILTGSACGVTDGDRGMPRSGSRCCNQSCTEHDDAIVACAHDHHERMNPPTASTGRHGACPYYPGTGHPPHQHRPGASRLTTDTAAPPSLRLHLSAACGGCARGWSRHAEAWYTVS
jgi:hypothetical protein